MIWSFDREIVHSISLSMKSAEVLFHIRIFKHSEYLPFQLMYVLRHQQVEKKGCLYTPTKTFTYFTFDK